jgi:hypothetical protein
LGFEMNTPYKAELHKAALLASGKGVKVSPPDAWGNSPSNQHYAAFDVPREAKAEFKATCDRLGLYCGWYGEAGYAHSGVSCLVVARFVKDPA